MLELLIVISIIGLLVAILVIAIGPAMGSAREAATKTTLEVLGNIVDQRAQAVMNADISAECKAWEARTTLTPQQAEFIVRKNLFRMALPQCKEDLYGLDRTAGTEDDSPLTAWDDTFGMDRIQGNADDGPPPLAVDPAIAWDDAQLLLRAVTAGSRVRSHGVFIVPAMPPTVPTPTVIAESKSYVLPVLDIALLGPNATREHGPHKLREPVDAWENPLAFYNWPTRLVRPGGDGAAISAAERKQAELVFGVLAAPLDVDPIDPIGNLQPVFAAAIPVDLDMNPVTPSTYSIAPFTEANYHTLATWSRPLIVAAGPDAESGFATPQGFDSVATTTDAWRRLAWMISANPTAIFPGSTPAEQAKNQQNWRETLFDNVVK